MILQLFKKEAEWIPWSKMLRGCNNIGGWPQLNSDKVTFTLEASWKWLWIFFFIKLWRKTDQNWTKEESKSEFNCKTNFAKGFQTLLRKKAKYLSEVGISTRQQQTCFYYYFFKSFSCKMSKITWLENVESSTNYLSLRWPKRVEQYCYC